MVHQQNKIETLHPDCLYLDTASSFNEAFDDKHLDEVKRVVVAQRVKFNAEVSHANKKGSYGDLFNMWLCVMVLRTSSLFLNLNVMNLS